MGSTGVDAGCLTGGERERLGGAERGSTVVRGDASGKVGLGRDVPMCARHCGLALHPPSI
jgi:hypothetical protein